VYSFKDGNAAMNTNNPADKTLEEIQADWAFDKLDELLEAATWKRGVVILKPGKNIIYCYDLEMLTRELNTLAEQYVQQKFRQTSGSYEDVVHNILEEYEEELARANIVKRARSRYKKAQ
jgi:hypothetical protein